MMRGEWRGVDSSKVERQDEKSGRKKGIMKERRAREIE